MIISPSYTIHISQALVKTVKFITTFVSTGAYNNNTCTCTVDVSLTGAIHSYCTGTCSWIIWTHTHVHVLLYTVYGTVYFNYYMYMYMYIQLLGVCVLI